MTAPLFSGPLFSGPLFSGPLISASKTLQRPEIAADSPAAPRVLAVIAGLGTATLVGLLALGQSLDQTNSQPLPLSISTAVAATTGVTPLSEATPLNAAQATDAPDDVMGEPVLTPDGDRLGTVGAVRMTASPRDTRIAALRIDPLNGGSSTWIQAERVWRLSSSVVVTTDDPQTAATR